VKRCPNKRTITAERQCHHRVTVTSTVRQLSASLYTSSMTRCAACFGETRPRTRRSRSRFAQARCRRNGRHCVMARAGAWGDEQKSSTRSLNRLGAADRLSRRLPLSLARDPRAGERRPQLAYGLHIVEPRPVFRRRWPATVGLSISAEIAIQADHRVLTAKDGFAAIERTEVALVASSDASPATLRLADRLAEFCDGVQAKVASLFLNDTVMRRRCECGHRRAHAP
jgi:hypothetical protein